MWEHLGICEHVYIVHIVDCLVWIWCTQDPESLLSSMFEEGSMTARLPPDEDLVLSQVLEVRS